MRDWKNYLLAIVGLICMAFFGCRTWLDKVTPVNIDEQVRLLAGTEPNDFGPIGPTLYDARKIKNQLTSQHHFGMLGLQRQRADLDWRHNFAGGLLKISIDEAEAWQQAVIGSEDNPVSILGLLASMGLTGVGTAVGRKYLRRPGDVTPDELNVAVEKAKNGG